MPTTIWDLTKPQWKGKIGLAADERLLPGVRRRDADQARRGPHARLAARPEGERRRASTGTTRRSSRRSAAARSCSGSSTTTTCTTCASRRRTSRSRTRFLGEGDPGALVNCAGVGIVSYAKKTAAAAERFVDFLLSPWAQRFIARGPGGAEYPLIRGVRPRPGLPQLGVDQGAGDQSRPPRSRPSARRAAAERGRLHEMSRDAGSRGLAARPPATARPRGDGVGRRRGRRSSRSPTSSSARSAPTRRLARPFSSSTTLQLVLDTALLVAGVVAVTLRARHGAGVARRPNRPALAPGLGRRADAAARDPELRRRARACSARSAPRAPPAGASTPRRRTAPGPLRLRRRAPRADPVDLSIRFPDRRRPRSGRSTSRSRKPPVRSAGRRSTSS